MDCQFDLAKTMWFCGYVWTPSRSISVIYCISHRREVSLIFTICIYSDRIQTLLQYPNAQRQSTSTFINHSPSFGMFPHFVVMDTRSTKLFWVFWRNKRHGCPGCPLRWPTWDVCLWALLVGPVAGLGAACFRRFIKFVEGGWVRGRATWGDQIWWSEPLRLEGAMASLAMERRRFGIVDSCSMANSRIVWSCGARSKLISSKRTGVYRVCMLNCPLPSFLGCTSKWGSHHLFEVIHLCHWWKDDGW